MHSQLIGFFLNFAGPIAFLGLLLWVNSLRKAVPLSWKEEWPLSLLSLAGAGVFFFSCSVDFKVLSDETNLLSVANMLTLFGKASNTELGTSYYHLYHALNLAIPTRPVLFPVLTSIVQHVVGVKHWAPFVVNFALTALLFRLSLSWARRTFGGALHPVVLTFLALLMSPVLAITATSAGYDLCSLVIAFTLFLLLARYNASRDGATLEAIGYGLVCFASVRYESIAAIPLMFAALCLFEGKAWLKRVPLSSFVFAFVLIVPLFVQRYLTWGNFENPPGVKAFSFDHLMNHLPVFIHSFFLDPAGPYPILLHWLGVAGIVLSLKKLREFDWLVLSYSSFLLCLLLSHHFGFANHPTQVRLFLPLTFALGLCAIYALTRLERFSEPKAILAIFLLLFLHHHQYAVGDPLSTQLTMTREVRHLRTYLAKEDHQDDLFVYDRPGQLTALGFSAVSWTYWEEHRAELLAGLRNRLYQRILTIDRPRYNGKPEDAPLIREGYRLTPLLEHQLSPEERLRVSRVDW